MTVGWSDYATRWAQQHGGYDPRRASPLVRGWLWLAYRIARLLGAARIGPDPVTAAGVLFAGVVPVTARFGGAWPLLGALLVVAGALADTVDGALALVSGRGSALGQVYDAVADRLSEALWLGAFWLLGAPGWLVAGCGAVSWLHEYVRARAAVAGMRELGAVTLAERPTRVLLAMFGLVVAGLVGLVASAAGVSATGRDSATSATAAGSVTAAAAIWLLLGAVGLVQLAAAVRRALRG
jgi:phosphatidylglycerophosphate synthase